MKTKNINVSRLSRQALAQLSGGLINFENSKRIENSVSAKEILIEMDFLARLNLRQKAIDMLRSKMQRNYCPIAMDILLRLDPSLAKAFCEQHLGRPFGIIQPTLL